MKAFIGTRLAAEQLGLTQRRVHMLVREGKLSGELLSRRFLLLDASEIAQLRRNRQRKRDSRCKGAVRENR